jgi:uncharacterized membrane protein
MNAKYDLEKIISLLLISCVSAGLILILAGLTLSGGKVANSEGYIPSSLIDWVAHGVSNGAPRALVSLGVALILLTPFLRTVFSLVWFILNKDRVYIAITGAVAIVLLLAIFGFISVF